MDILTAVRDKGIELKRVATTHGGEYAGPCPMCGGRDRFRVWPAKKDNQGGGWWCRQCQKGGDLIQFFREADGMSYKEACAAAGLDARQYSYPKPNLPKPEKERFKANTHERPAEKWLEHAGKFVETCHENLMDNDQVLQWLKTKRGINKDTAASFKLGLNSDQKYFRPRSSWGLPEETNSKTGKPKMLWIPRGLVIPLMDGSNVLRIRVRRTKTDLRSDTDPRYYVVPGSSPAIMCIGDNRRAYMAIETELDAILAAQEAGDLIGAIGLGTSTAKPDQPTMANLIKSEIILVSLDYDAGGAKGVDWWLEQFNQAERWPVPVGKDPGDMAAAGVPIRQWILAGLPPAWHIGESGLKSTEKNGADEKKIEETASPQPEAEKSSDPADALPESVAELYGLLKNNPVSITVTDKQISLQRSGGWTNDRASRRISDLVYFETECFNYLHGLGIDRVNGSNFLGTF